MAVNKLSKLAFALVLSGPLCASVQAASVTFSNFSDSNHATVIDPRELFDTANNNVLPTALGIGLSDFTADGNIGGANVSAFDTLSFKIVADPGSYITTVTYNESGRRAIGALGGVTLSTGSVVANGQASSLGLVLGTSPTALWVDWSLGTAFDFSGQQLTEVVVTITNSLLAVGNAAISKEAASITVGLTPVPVPPAMMLFGGALMTLAAWRTRPQGSKTEA